MHSNKLSGLTTAVWKTAAEHGVPVVHTLHDYYLVCPRCSRFARGHSCERTCPSCRILTINRKRATRWLTAVVGVSQRVLDINTSLGLFADTPVLAVIRNASTAVLQPHTPTCPHSHISLAFLRPLPQE